MYKRKIMAILLVLMISIPLVTSGCSGDSSDAGSSSVNNEKIEIAFGHEFGNETPQQAAILKFKEQVEEESNGNIKVNVFPAGQMGNARELFESLQIGSLQVSAIPTARISGFAPQLQMLDLPFLFGDEEGRSKILDGEIGKELLATLSDQKVIGVSFYDDGFKQMTANKELTSLDDFKGLKFRTMESPIIMEQYKALGAEPVPIEYAELYNSLQLKVVDGQENPIVHIYDNKYYEVQSKIMMTNHAPLSGLLMYSEEWYNDLPQEYKDILSNAGKDFSKNLRTNIQQKEEQYLKEMREKGVDIVDLTDSELEVFREVTLPVHDIYIEQFGDEILNKIYEALK